MVVDKIVEDFRRKISRKATVLELGGFRPPLDPLSSWFGDVTVCVPGESWPHVESKPMHALAQVNLLEFHSKPSGLKDIDLLTLFIGPDKLPIDTLNGDGWEIRAYRDLSELVPIDKVVSGSGIKKLPMRSRVLENDYPCWEDVAGEVPEELEESYYDLFANTDGFKFGGWPSLIQSEINWPRSNNHIANPQYVFQIDSTEKGNWAWGDAGVGYFGRSTTAGQADEWVLDWQCM